MDYAPGDTVSGQVELLVADGDLEVTSIFVQLIGKAYCIWNEGKYTHFATEHPYDQVQTLRGEGATAANRTGPLTQGSHRLPYKFQLSNPLVSTYRDAIGYVKYTVKVKLTRPWHSLVKTKRVITVRQSVDLNQLQGMTTASGGTEETTVCCGCLSGPIEGEVHTDRTGYAPGGWILANATLKNNSSSKVKKTTLGLARRVTYITPWRTRKTPWTIAYHSGPSCAPGKTIHLNNIKLPVPETVPTNTSLKIMKFEYAVMLQGHLRAFTFDARTFAPITIGSIPLPRPGEADVSREAGMWKCRLHGDITCRYFF